MQDTSGGVHRLLWFLWGISCCVRIGRWRQQCRCLVSRLPACTFQFVLKGDETTYNRLCIFWRRCFGLIAVAYFSGDSVNRKSVASEGNQHSWVAFTSHLAWASPVWSMTRRSIVSLQMTEGESDTTLREPSMPIHKFVQTSDEACSKSTTWSTWPQAQERAIENGTVLVWNVVSSIGHFMRTLVYILPVSDGQTGVFDIYNKLQVVHVRLSVEDRSRFHSINERYIKTPFKVFCTTGHKRREDILTTVDPTRETKLTIYDRQITRPG